jgi:hypothetical protein
MPKGMLKYSAAFRTVMAEIKTEKKEPDLFSTLVSTSTDFSNCISPAFSSILPLIFLRHHPL